LLFFIAFLEQPPLPNIEEENKYLLLCSTKIRSSVVFSLD
jgi:hypothetical protein